MAVIFVIHCKCGALRGDERERIGSGCRIAYDQLAGCRNTHVAHLNVEINRLLFEDGTHGKSFLGFPGSGTAKDPVENGQPMIAASGAVGKGRKATRPKMANTDWAG